MMRTVDTDVLFLVISTVTNLEDTEILVAFGTGKNFRCIPAYEIAKQLIIEKTCAYPMFHSFAGCDTLS